MNGINYLPISRILFGLLREKKDVDQRMIVKEADFSKAKVSRIIQELIKRDLIEKIPKGRNNLIRLKKIRKTAKS